MGTVAGTPNAIANRTGARGSSDSGSNASADAPSPTGSGGEERERDAPPRDDRERPDTGTGHKPLGEPATDTRPRNPPATNNV